jgi:diguanylate cyclase (GGDEF)-like protein
LTLPQSLFTLILVWWSYAISGPTRGAALLALMMVIFFAPFALDRRQSLLVAGMGLAGLAGVMLWRVFGGPPHYAPSTELVHFFATLIVVSCEVAVSVQLSNLRGRLSRQKKDLQTALERIQDLATRDGLTGLLNRRAMLEKLDQEAQRVRRGAAPVAIVLIDLDHFKRINDTQGHACGDRLLCLFAGVAQEGLRASDALARWGGEEFLLALPMTTPEEAAVCVDRVRRRLAAVPLDSLAPGLALTFSAGIALCHDSADIARSIDCADQALYKAKALGRNRSVVAQPAAGVKDAAVPGSVAPARPAGARATAAARNTAAS